MNISASAPTRRIPVMLRQGLILLLGVACLGAAAAPAPPLYIGFLETLESKTEVRVAFSRSGTSWMPMRNDFETVEDLRQATRTYPDSVDWVAVYDGRKIGTVKSRNPKRITNYSMVGTQEVIIAAPIPQVSTGANEFVSWKGPHKSRPLLLVS